MSTWLILAQLALTVVLVAEIDNWRLPRAAVIQWRGLRSNIRSSIRRRFYRLTEGPSSSWVNFLRSIRIANWFTPEQIRRYNERSAEASDKVEFTKYRWHEVYVAHQLRMSVSEFRSLDEEERLAFIVYFGASRELRKLSVSESFDLFNVKRRRKETKAEQIRKVRMLIGEDVPSRPPTDQEART